MKASALVLLLAGFVHGQQPSQEKTPGAGFIGATVRVQIENNEMIGILIVETIKDGPADKAGLMAEDIVVRIDDKPTKDLNTFKEIVLKHKPGDDVMIHFKRDGKEAEFRLTIGERPS